MKTKLNSDFSPPLSLRTWLCAWLYWCAFPRCLTQQQECLPRWHSWSGCQRKNLKMWRTCGTWRQDFQGHVETVHYWLLPHCGCYFLGRQRKTLLAMQLCRCAFIKVLFLTWQRGSQHSFFSYGTEKDIQTLLVRDVNRLHLIQQVHIHLHRRDAANRSCSKKRNNSMKILLCIYMAHFHA